MSVSEQAQTRTRRAEQSSSSAYQSSGIGDALSLRLWVPEAQVGRVIGKKGATIQHLVGETACSITLLPRSPESQWRPLSVRGQYGGVRAAADMVCSLVDEVDDAVLEFPLYRSKGASALLASRATTVPLVSASTGVRVLLPEAAGDRALTQLEGPLAAVYRALDMLLHAGFGDGQGAAEAAGTEVVASEEPRPSASARLLVPAALVEQLLAKSTGARPANALGLLQRYTGTTISREGGEQEEGVWLSVRGASEQRVALAAAAGARMVAGESVSAVLGELEDAFLKYSLSLLVARCSRACRRRAPASASASARGKARPVRATRAVASVAVSSSAEDAYGPREAGKEGTKRRSTRGGKGRGKGRGKAEASAADASAANPPSQT